MSAAPRPRFVRDLIDRAERLRASAERGLDKARRVVREARREAEEVARRAGVPTKSAPIIDVGATPGTAVRLWQAAAGALVLALLAGGALALALFVVQILGAYLVSTRVLGLRVDVGPEVAT